MANSKPEQNGPVESIEPSKEEAMSSEGAARRDALAVLAKHVAYTAPAVLAVLGITTNRAKAFSF